MARTLQASPRLPAPPHLRAVRAGVVAAPYRSAIGPDRGGKRGRQRSRVTDDATAAARPSVLPADIGQGRRQQLAGAYADAHVADGRAAEAPRLDEVVVRWRQPCGL